MFYDFAGNDSPPLPRYFPKPIYRGGVIRTRKRVSSCGERFQTGYKAIPRETEQYPVEPRLVDYETNRKRFLKGAIYMERKSPIIRQGKVTELMAELASLPVREKAPEDPITLSEMFRTKEYLTEVKAALKKGYTFENLAAIFTERCNVAVSARQIRYHFTHGQNRGMKNKSCPKSGRAVSLVSKSKES
jgi:hypothetical protein